MKKGKKDSGFRGFGHLAKLMAENPLARPAVGQQPRQPFEPDLAEIRQHLEDANYQLGELDEKRNGLPLEVAVAFDQLVEMVSLALVGARRLACKAKDSGVKL
jgi:hypothetical protein